MRSLTMCFLLLQCVAPVLAQNDLPSSESGTALCTFEDGQQISVQYNNSASPTAEEPRNGKPWRPAGAPMTLFTQTTLVINKVEIAPGAYSLWLIPDKKSWTLVVNKNVKADSPYDPAEDLVREPMELGQLAAPAKVADLGFAHMAPKQCNLRVYYGKIGAWGDINQK